MPKNEAPKRAHSIQVQIRVLPEQAELYKQAASRDNRTLSNWARDRLDKAAHREMGKDAPAE